MAGKVKTWVWVLVAIVVLGILGVVAMAGVGFYIFSQSFDTKTVSASEASSEFDTIKARFAERRPLIELDDRGHFKRANHDRPSNHGARPNDLYVMAFDPDDGRIVRVKVPFWLLRLKLGGATVDFNGSRMDLDDLKLTIEDLERLGSALIVDHTSSSGERVLVWSQ